ncbi:flavodoxin [Methanobrevibacter sp. TMH8]|uniref:flavodoxin family protein n=1 Tax=Methanobrevibacter sp. TMH8 TaxID=2848611 RepID=UPI001CCB5B36|nr:flavodoxin [Methanobrevibacter sp. TMH8]MBZ9571708.1 flavodoxin [Methanobrevibacter sp. TMH8]
MKILVTYYSRTQTTARVAKEIQKKLNCDIEEIIDINKRSGVIGYLKGGYDAMKSKPAKIKPIEKNPSEYDLVIVGTPVWASTMAPAILEYLKENKEKFNDVSFFCTCGGSGYDKTLAKMEEVADKNPLNNLYLTKNDIESSFDSKIEGFIKNIENIEK